MNLFSLLVGIGASLGLLQIARSVPNRREHRVRVPRGGFAPDSAVPWVAAGLAIYGATLLGAHAAYVWIHPHLYAEGGGWGAYLRVWEDGLAWPGGLAGALLAFLLCTLALRAPLRISADVFIPSLIPVAAMAWLGCGQAGCAYGAEISTYYPWALPVIDEHAVLTYRWPLAYVAAASLLYLAWRAERAERAESGGQVKQPNRADQGRPAREVNRPTPAPRTPGRKACISSLILAVHSLVFSTWRADTAPTWDGLRLDYIAAIGLGVLSLLGLAILAFLSARKSRIENRESVSQPRSNKLTGP